MSDTIYVGSGKKRKDNWLTISINPDKLKDHIQEYKGSKFVKLNVNIFDKENQFGKDVSVSIDTYKPNNTDNQEPI